VAYNPLNAVDPLGLILFAFDGTGNSESPKSGSSISNVQKFYRAYDVTKNGEKFYITGIGTTNEDMPTQGSEAVGTGFRERLDLATKFLVQFINTDSANSDTWLDVDVVGFSRGAAEARAWVSAIEKSLGESRVFQTANTGQNMRCINFRFLGLWDTVPHLGATHSDEKYYDFSIPDSVQLAVHAVAVNEHRGGGADFDALSIHDNATVANSTSRIERGFVGAHSDVGGGYGEGDLSDVALMWIIQQADKQSIKFDEELMKNNGWSVVTNPIVHDPRVGNWGTFESLWPDDGDRNFNYLNSKGHTQSEVTLASGVTTTASSKEAIEDFTKRCGDDGSVVGFVDVVKYKDWVKDIGVTFDPMATLPKDCSLKK